MEKFDSAALKAALTDGKEIALLDPREEGAFSMAHLLLAVNLPLSRLELRAETLVPRKSTRIVLTDAGDGLSERTARRLQELGYAAVSILEGGVPAWRACGYEVFSGVNVPSKAFGEYVEHQFQTPSIPPEELQAKLAAGERPVVLDSRPRDEYERMTIPGAINIPGAELVYRFGALPIGPETLVVVNCAGRTRSILGAQSLIQANVTNRVVALRGGTMAWELAGYRCEHNAGRRPPEPADQARQWAREAAARVAKRAGVGMIDGREFQAYENERDRRSLYLIDVRTPEEYAAGHLPGSIHAPGGQLIQATDQTIGARNARVVLIDDQIVRAQMTASWLLQAGWPHVRVLADPFAGKKMETGISSPRIPGLRVQLPAIQPAALQEALRAGTATVVDFAASPHYRQGHIPGAWFAVRARLQECLGKIPAADHWVATGDDGALTALAAADLAELSGKPVSVLAGGNSAWRKAGLPVKEGFESLATETDDVWLKPYQRTTGVKEAMAEYLSWEVDLPRQVERDGTLRFGVQR